jgi:hypothetical protein
MRQQSKRRATRPAFEDSVAPAEVGTVRWLPFLLFITINALLLFEGINSFERISGNLTKVYVWKAAGAGLGDLGLVLAIASIPFLSFRSAPILRFRGPMLIAVLVVVASLNGYSRQGLGEGAFANDLRTFSWLFAGVISGLLLWDSGRVRAGLMIIVALGTALMALSAYAAYQANIDTNGRLGTPSMYWYSYYLYAPTALLISMFFQASAMARTVAAAAVALHLYLHVYLGATKSILLTLVVLVFFGLLSAAVIKRPDGTAGLEKRSASWLTLCALALGSFVILVFSYAAQMSISQRFSDAEDRTESIQSRAEEARVMIPQLSVAELWLGRGMGARFETTIAQEEVASETHIAIFTFLLKFGLPVFACLVFFAYVFIPWRYVQSIAGFGVQDLNERVAFVKAMPAFFAWVAILSMSGGFNSYAFLGAGLTYATFQKLSQEEQRESAGQTDQEAETSLATGRGQYSDRLTTAARRSGRFGPADENEAQQRHSELE